MVYSNAPSPVQSFEVDHEPSVVGNERKSTDYTLDGTIDWHGNPVLRSKSGGWRSARFILGQQVLANLTYFGLGKNMVMYLTSVMHQGNARASNFVTNWTGAVFIAPILGAILADSMCGRYSITLISSLVYVAGTLMVVFAAYLPSMHPQQCSTHNVSCESPTSGQMKFLAAGFYITAIAGGAMQAPITALGADQFDEEDDIEKAQKSSFFNWFYQAITVGAMLAAVGIVTLQEEVSWGMGFVIACAAAVAALVSVLLGSRSYRFHRSDGNVLFRIAQVFVAAARNWRLKAPAAGGIALHEEAEDREASHRGRRILRTTRYKFLDRAAIAPQSHLDDEDDKTSAENCTDDGGSSNSSPWKLCTVTQVEEVKRLIQFTPIFLTIVIYTTVYVQLSTLFVVQGATMDTRILPGLRIAPASLSVIENISVVVWIVLYDQVVVPLVRRYTGNPRGFTDLQRIGIGLGLSVVAMVVAARVEMTRLRTAKQHDLLDDPNTKIPMSVLWEIPQYSIIGASEVFTYIGLIEFFYDQSPDVLRSVGSALGLLPNAFGSYISTALVTLVNNITAGSGEHSQWIPDNLNRGHVDLFYWLLATLSFFNLLAFILCAKCYRPLQQVPIPRRI